ncbi:hypothetical protein FDI59_gp034 [Mycobacterium phage Yoshi]|uniref:Uncharacterized protein n=1 Tax=Mycobacterium phage Yoshi TaxID=2920891 RepID=G1BSE1_9CAUD|nr:hypothetical protein FDI59_gp034 [Mycobacterium phage Yoshi]AEK07785.1 hypothetical protein YOSHI_34 [Mycobacterium phage Yoshi]
MMVNVPGYGLVHVELKVETERVENGELVCRVFVDLPTPPDGGGEPLPVAA